MLIEMVGMINERELFHLCADLLRSIDRCRLQMEMISFHSIQWEVVEIPIDGDEIFSLRSIETKDEETLEQVK